MVDLVMLRIILLNRFCKSKAFIGLYILKQDVMKKYKDELKGVTIGKGVIRKAAP